MIKKLLKNLLMFDGLNIFIGFYHTFKAKFKDYIITYSKLSVNEARYAFAGDIE